MKKTDPRNTIVVFSEGQMNPLTYYEHIIKMPNKADKFDLRLRIVKHAIANGVKPTAKLFAVTVKTVRKWLRRYHQERLAGLNELPRIPLHCPHKTSPVTERKIVNLRKKYPFKGSKRLKREHNLQCSHEAIRRILKEHDLIVKRRRKHKRKRDLSEIKKKWPLFGQITVDTKDLKDMPHYWPQMKNLKVAQISIYRQGDTKRDDVFGLCQREVCLKRLPVCTHTLRASAKLRG